MFGALVLASSEAPRPKGAGEPEVRDHTEGVEHPDVHDPQEDDQEVHHVKGVEAEDVPARIASEEALRSYHTDAQGHLEDEDGLATPPPKGPGLGNPKTG